VAGQVHGHNSETLRQCALDLVREHVLGGTRAMQHQQRRAVATGVDDADLCLTCGYPHLRGRFGPSVKNHSQASHGKWKERLSDMVNKPF
jgi:hypothetical protein